VNDVVRTSCELVTRYLQQQILSFVSQPSIVVAKARVKILKQLFLHDLKGSFDRHIVMLLENRFQKRQPLGDYLKDLVCERFLNDKASSLERFFSLLYLTAS
jgi:hypothetical protein